MAHVHTSVEGGVGLLTLARPARLNSLDVQTAQELRRAGLLLSRDPAVRVVVLRGQPGCFCSGADLKYIRAGGDDADLGYLAPPGVAVRRGPGEIFKQILEYLHATISEIHRSPKPWIAAVDGIAAAGGFGLAMSCDLVFASERASFEWAYGKTALTGAESSTFVLPRLVGLRRAFGMAFLNPRLTAQQADKADLINGVLPADGFDAEVAAIARRVATGPPKAFAVTKALLNESAGLDRLDLHLARELEALVRSADAPEFAEGISAFFDKRPPRFGG